MTADRAFKHAAILTAAFGAVSLSFGATGQSIGQTAPLPAPSSVPASRLTVEPAAIERWMAAFPPADVPQTPTAEAGTPATRDGSSAPSVATVPPAPRLVPPPPPPPSLVVAPPPPALAAPVPPTPPVPPREPGTATLPPESPVTTDGPVETAALPRPADLDILYQKDETEPPASARPELDRLAVWLRGNPNIRVDIVSYAGSHGTSGTQARRTSLDRALAVRKYLVEKGVLSTRMNVQARGDKSDSLHRDRVVITLPRP